MHKTGYFWCWKENNYLVLQSCFTGCRFLTVKYARVAELVDALDSKSKFERA